MSEPFAPMAQQHSSPGTSLDGLTVDREPVYESRRERRAADAAPSRTSPKARISTTSRTRLTTGTTRTTRTTSPTDQPSRTPSTTPSTTPALSRRTLLIGGATAAAAVSGTGYLMHGPDGSATAAVTSRLKEGDWAVMTDVVQAHLGRAMWSSRQLYEVMVDFWSNHLNVTCPSSDVWDTRHRYDADVIRKNALGSFETMLAASAVHPSMLVYLNNAESTGREPNENYARELLELHTVGIDGGYTERDIKRSALLLTGWKVERGKARYESGRHHVGSMRVMGFKHSNSSGSGGRTAQRAYLSYLARHPRTARTIAYKLAVRFVSDDPPAALVDRLAATYRKNKTAIKPVLRELFSSPEFAASAGQKIRRPFEHVVATARVIGVKPGTDSQGLLDLAYMLGAMGHAPLGWSPPDGYPDVAASWQSPAAALGQFNATSALVHGWWPTKLDLPGPKELLATTPRTRDGVIDAVARKLFGRSPIASQRSAAATLLAGTKLPSSFGSGSWEQQETVALTTTLFLHSPAHLTR